MTHTIAVAGKGGTGKTTLCGFLIDALVKRGDGLVLAVDADANSNLNEVLGVTVEETLGEIREDIAQSGIAKDSKVPAGWSKQDYMDFRFNNAIVEQDNYDMLVMGRTQGKGCYCFVNGLLQAEIQKFASNYRYIVASFSLRLFPARNPGGRPDRETRGRTRSDPENRGPHCQPCPKRRAE